MDLLRSSVRPVVTYALVFGYLWGTFHPGQVEAVALERVYSMLLICLTFWYGERALGKLGLSLGRK